MTDEYQIITLSTQLPFVNDAVYIILTELLFNAIGNWNGIAYVNLIDHCGAINEQTMKH